MGEWILVEDDQTIQDYLNGHIAPLDSREDDWGLWLWVPHEWQYGRMTGTKTCARCGLLPLDYDGVEVPCRDDSEEE